MYSPSLLSLVLTSVHGLMPGVLNTDLAHYGKVRSLSHRRQPKRRWLRTSSFKVALRRATVEIGAWTEDDGMGTED
jgi:hypothetical protein